MGDSKLRDVILQNFLSPLLRKNEEKILQNDGAEGLRVQGPA
jgi:hypothetical protein